MGKRITACQHCGSTVGFYTKSTYKNVIWRGNFDGTEQDNTEMYKAAEISGGGLAYCIACNKVICRTSTLLEHY